VAPFLWACIVALLCVTPADITGLTGRARRRAWLSLAAMYVLGIAAILLESFD